MEIGDWHCNERRGGGNKQINLLFPQRRAKSFRVKRGDRFDTHLGLRFGSAFADGLLMDLS